jgi:hypothetical protein
MAPGASYGGATRSVIPVGRRMQPCSAPIQADQQLLDQQSIIDDGIHY